MSLRRSSIFTSANSIRTASHKEARGGGEYGGFLAAGDESHNRNVMIDVRPDKGMSEVSITVVAKK